MTTTTQTEVFDIKQELRDDSIAPPPYADGETIELHNTVTETSSNSSLPEYAEASSSSLGAAGSAGTFHPTKSLQVENRGLPVIALPLPPRPHPIPVYAIAESGAVGTQLYESIRPTRGSGSCILSRVGGDAVCTTTYRFGPGRPPKIRLLGLTSIASAADTLRTAAAEEPLGAGDDEEFEVVSRGITTRAVSIRTHLGTFRWRYAGRSERREVGADSLLVMELVTKLALEGGKTEERYRRVAQLVRNEEFRTPGSGRSTAGNGGRLMMDLRDWMAEKKGESEQMEALVVASCICMLKKEMDRRRMHQAMAISGGAGGGP